jgi:gluconate 2-dehydrogenase
LSQHDGALTTGTDPVNGQTLSAQPRLKIAANMAVGFNNFDVPALTNLGVTATNTPDVLTETTADFGFALLMATARRMTESEHYLRAGHWKQWRYDMFAGAEVHGSTLGIIGMGRIGQGIARRGALGFGMKVIYHNRTQLSPQLEAECKASYVSKETLLQTADHVMLVVPYSAASHHTIGAAELALMKPTATLVNIARGGIVDDAALAKALATRQIAAAGLDVFEGEPAVHPELLKVPNVVLTPHIASATTPTRLAMAQLAADNLVSYFTKGHALTPLNQVAKAS